MKVLFKKDKKINKNIGWDRFLSAKCKIYDTEYTHKKISLFMLKRFYYFEDNSFYNCGVYRKVIK